MSRAEDSEIERLDGAGEQITLRVTLSHDGGWDLYLEVDGRLQFVTHCTDWHRLERARARIQVQIALSRPCVPELDR
jgi:hypothetical protein